MSRLYWFLMNKVTEHTTCKHAWNFRSTAFNSKLCQNMFKNNLALYLYLKIMIYKRQNFIFCITTGYYKLFFLHHNEKKIRILIISVDSHPLYVNYCQGRINGRLIKIRV